MSGLHWYKRYMSRLVQALHENGYRQYMVRLVQALHENERGLLVQALHEQIACYFAEMPSSSFELLLVAD